MAVIFINWVHANTHQWWTVTSGSHKNTNGRNSDSGGSAFLISLLTLRSLFAIINFANFIAWCLQFFLPNLFFSSCNEQPGVIATFNAKTTETIPICSQCATFGNAGNAKPNCCAFGGAWFGKCGSDDDPNAKYTWSKGHKACVKPSKKLRTFTFTARNDAWSHTSMPNNKNQRARIKM